MSRCAASHVIFNHENCMSESRIYWLIAALTGAVGLYVYYLSSQSFQNALSAASTSSDGTTSGGGLIEAITQLPQEAVSTVDRGFRNNNPGNIKPTSDTEFNGQTGRDAQGFGIFSSMEYGIRAIAVILKNYENRDGLNTVREMITRWSTTDQSAYVADVSAYVGVGPDDPIDVNDPATLEAMIQGIITQENGQLLAATITGAQIANGVALA